jgi:indole-3-glycerol phosphate synthase
MRDTPDILAKILAAKRKRLSTRRGTSADVRRMAGRKAASAPALDFLAVLSRPGLSVIAEIKKASPSAGTIRSEFEPAKIASAYAKADADAISVLTEQDFFKGSPAHLRLAKRNATDLPVLRKDFICDEFQVLESRIMGADSFLLICAMLTEKKLLRLLQLGRSLGMEPLVETHDSEDLQMALDSGARIVGINNRNLRTFEVDIRTSLELAGKIPDGIIKVSESGIKTPDDSRLLREAGFDAILVGETLMRNSIANFAKIIKSLKG